MKQLPFSQLFFFVGVLLGMAGCHNKKNQVASQAFNSVYQKFDKFYFTDSMAHKLDSVFVKYKNLPFSDKYNYYLFKCSYYHINKKNDPIALLYADSVTLLIEKNKETAANNNSLKAMAYLSKGDILFSMKRFNDAIQYYYVGKIAAEHSNSSETLAELYYRMAMVMFKKMEYNKAADYFIASFLKSDKQTPLRFSQFYRLQEVLNNIAFSYVKANQPSKALYYYNTTDAFIKKYQNQFSDQLHLLKVAKAVMLGTAGEAFLLQNNVTEGEKLLQQSIQINTLPGFDHGNAIQKQLSLVHYYLDTTHAVIQTTKAKRILDDIKKELDTFTNEEYAGRWNYLMSRYYDKTGNSALAFSHLEAYTQYVLKNESETKELAETNINTYFQAMQNQYEMELLKKTGETERNYLIAAILLIALCCVIGLLIWRNWQNSKEHVHILTKLNRKVKNQKKELEITLQKLNKRSEEKDRILKVVAHDLRNPITAINALTRLLKDDPTLDVEQTECLDLISKASKQSLELIDTIMQIEDNQMLNDADKTANDINAVVQSCTNELRAAANEKNQDLTVSLSPKPQIALIDSDKIERVIKNLLTNAIKFSYAGSCIQVSVKENDNDVIIKIKDDGIGIPANLKHKVFDTFTKARRLGTNDEKTYGLGLSICKQFVEAHGGKIWFTSLENEGSTFYVKLQKQNTRSADAVVPLEEALS